MPPAPGADLRHRRLAESRVFCMAPWTQLHVLPTGEIFTCCMAAEPKDAIGNLRKGDTLRSAWNSGPMRALRLAMLRDEPSPACQLCYKGEGVGQGSLRTAENHHMAARYPVVERTAPDGSLDAFDVPTLDIRFSNVCNLRCRICSAKLSSAWHGDAERLGWVDGARPAVLTATEDPDTLLDQVLELLPGVERMHFAGGEPLMSEEHFVILERLRALDHRSVRLTYNTNLSKLRFRHWDVIALWREFPAVYVQASLDGMGARGEMMRKGQRWEDAVANRRRLLQECPHVEFVVHATVSIMNVLHLPALYRAWLEEGLIGAGGMQLNLLHGPPYYNVRGLPPRLKDEVESSYGPFIAWLESLGNAAAGPKRDFEAVIRYMRAEDWNVSEEFLQRTRELDVLREETFSDAFPELAEWVASGTAPDRIRTAQAHARLGNPAAARAELDAFLRDHGIDARADLRRQAHALRGRLRRAAGDLAGAREDLAAAAALAGKESAGGAARVNPAVVDVSDMNRGSMGAMDHYERGKQLRQLGNCEGALESFSLAVTSAPDEAVAWLTQRLREVEQAWPGMLDDTEPARRDALDNPVLVYYLRGLARTATGDVAGAREDFDRVSALAPVLRAAEAARRALEPPREPPGAG